MGEEKLKPMRIRIKQFQSIEDLDLEIRGFVCVTGKTNIGKSALIRAIAYSATNHPVGGLVRHGAKFCSVHVQSDDGWSYLWEKGERVNRYTIDGKVYDKVGQNQPPELKEVGFSDIDIGKRNLYPWWATQFAPVFLLDETGASITDFISKVSRLSIIQDAIVLSSRGKKVSMDEARVRSESASKMKERLSKVSGADDMVKLRDELIEQAKSIEEYENKIKLVHGYKDKLDKLAFGVKSLISVSNVKLPDPKEVERSVSSIVAMKDFWGRLESSAKKIISLKESQKAVIPHAPTEEVDRLKKIHGLLKTPSLKKSVDNLSAVNGVNVPPVPSVSNDVESLKHAIRLKKKLDAIKQSVDNMSGEIIVPGSTPDLNCLRSIVSFKDRMHLLKEEVSDLESKSRDLSEDLDEVNEAIKSIPVCDSCGRPTSYNRPEHDHEDGLHLGDLI